MPVERNAYCEFGGFADGRSLASPNSEQIEPAEPLGFKAKLCERGANPRQPCRSNHYQKTPHNVEFFVSCFG